MSLRSPDLSPLPESELRVTIFRRILERIEQAGALGISEASGAAEQFRSMLLETARDPGDSIFI